MKTQATLGLLSAFLLFAWLTTWPQPPRTLHPISGGSVVEYYLDPDYTGTHTGSASQPFNTLDSAAWSTINGSLATDDVVLYCSARDAGSDTDEIWDGSIIVSNKTPNPTGTLTIDGRSKYNTNDASPSWTAYSGSSRCRVSSVISQNAGHTKINKVTIDGLKIRQTTSTATKGLSICGDNWLVKNTEAFNVGSPGPNQPLVLIVPTADGGHEGTSEWCPASTNIVLQDNNFHDSWGELLYVGGAGCADAASTADKQALRTDNGACGGVPGHDHITIQRNALDACGHVTGGEGDCIDIKADVKFITITQNTMSKPNSQGRCIVTQGVAPGVDMAIVIERNDIHHCTDNNDTRGGVTFSNTWGTPNGIEIRNNLLREFTSVGGPADAIIISGSQASPGITIYNNTFYNNPSSALSNTGTATFRNNAILNSGGIGNAGTVTATHNASSTAFGVPCTSCLTGLTSAAFVDAAGGNFALTPTSVLINQGTTLGSFSNDYTGGMRSAPWDIGAYEYGATGGGGGGTPPGDTSGFILRIRRR